MLEKSVIDYADALASKDPVPGGGGAAAVVAALGIALGTMVGNLTLGKKRYFEVQDEIQELMARSERLRETLQELSEADADVFLPLSTAYGMPARTEGERTAKDAVLQPALLAAAEVPMEICRKTVEVISLLARYAEIGSRIAISDVACGAAIARAALESAQLNVLINTRLMSDIGMAHRLNDEAAALVAQGVREADAIVVSIRNQLALLITSIAD
jgi:formiminotetrahydrofolate cyclodeaminase